MEEEKNNKVKKDKLKQKRKVSILTVFLWLALIAVMSVITVSGIVKNNAVEGETRKITVKIDFSEMFEEMEIPEEDKIEAMKERNSMTLKTNNAVKESDMCSILKFITNEGDIGVYEANISDEAKYIVYVPMICNLDTYYTIDKKTDDIAYISIMERLIYYGEEIKENQELYEAKIKTRTLNNPEKIKMKIGVEGIEEENLKDEIYNSINVNSNFTYVDKNGNEENAYKSGLSLKEYEEDGKVIAEYSNILPDKILKFRLNYYIKSKYIEGYNSIVKYEINGIIYYDWYDMSTILHTLNSEKELNIDVTIIYIKENTKATNKVKWLDKEKGIAEIELGYTSTQRSYIPTSIFAIQGKTIYKEKLSDDFILSPEYENVNKWSILDSVSSEEEKGIPKDVLNEFSMVEENSSAGKEYVYVKETNIIYWLKEYIELEEVNTKINVVYKGYEKLTNEIELENSKNSTLVYDNSDYYSRGERDVTYIENYNIVSPKLKFSHKKEAVIKVKKNVKGEVGENTYYVGIFGDKNNVKADKVYEIKTENGKGSIAIDTEGEKVYIYEVDKLGNKLVDENIQYSKNKLEFKDYVRDSKITTDKSVISSVMSETIGKFNSNNLENNDEKWKIEIELGSYGFKLLKSAIANTDVNKTVGTGEEDYVDNVLEVVDIYQEEVLISSEEIKYKVEYVAEEGGTLEGITNEVVKANEYVTNVPKTIPNEGHKFVRFEVEENGKRVEVEPSKYVITKDTAFYVVFEKIPEEVMGLPNTSDINVYMYVGIFVIAIIVIVIVLLIINKNKTNKK